MLVLSRESGETIKINDDIVIKVLSDKRVKLGIEAPHDVRVKRGELQDKQDEAPESEVRK